MASNVAVGEESKHVIVIDPHANAAGKASTTPLVQCIYCNHKFRGGSTRIGGHLAAVKGCGVSACDDVPEHVKQHFVASEACLHLQQSAAAQEDPGH